VPRSEENLKIMDDMISKLAESPPYELPGAVSRAIKICGSPTFFLRIAERVDMTDSASQKEKLRALADNLTSVVSAVVQSGEEKMELLGERVKAVLLEAAEEDGEFYVPLKPSKVQAMRSKVDSFSLAELDEGFLTTVESWMDRSSKDGLDGMVVIFQTVLQAYSGSVIERSRDNLIKTVAEAVAGEEMEAEKGGNSDSPAGEFFTGMLRADPQTWDSLLLTLPTEDGADFNDLLNEIQKTIEGVVLGMENGSMGQRVCAEFLREMVTRVEAARQASAARDGD